MCAALWVDTCHSIWLGFSSIDWPGTEDAMDDAFEETSGSVDDELEPCSDELLDDSCVADATSESFLVEVLIATSELLLVEVLVALPAARCSASASFNPSRLSFVAVAARCSASASINPSRLSFVAVASL
jgi:hypothetical protein